MTALRILVILDDGDPTLATLAAELRAGGHEVKVTAPAAMAATLADGPFDAVVQAPRPQLAPTAPLDDAERTHIAAALRHTRGNKRQAAHMLGIARSTLLAKVRKYGL
ncbi:MAG TPA: helix-turn-helix domain-containing protein [Gemmatimonadales bacterium]|nr:helix-turn-helix domain-containing protein [Gemmatimonadales bacterium]